MTTTQNPADLIPVSAIERVYGHDVRPGDVLVDERVPGGVAAIVCGVHLSESVHEFGVLGWSDDGDIDDDMTLGRAATVGRLRNVSAVYGAQVGVPGYLVRTSGSRRFMPMADVAAVMASLVRTVGVVR